MGTPIQEPNDIPSGEITDENAGNYAVVVYKKDNDGAGLKKLGLAPWKQFLGFNSHKVTNVATWVGVPEQYYDVDTDQDPPSQTLVERLNQLRDNSGVSDQPQESGFIPLNTRVGTLEDTVGTPTSGGVLDGTTVCAKIEENSGDISDIETFLGDSSSVPGSDNVSGRLQDVEGKVSNLQTEVETTGTGLLARATAIESILGTPSSSSVIVPGANSVCQQVEHNTGEIEELWDSIGGSGGGSSSLTSRIETLEQDMPTKADLTDVAPIFSNTTNYSIGDYVIYNNNLYRFTSNHEQGDWNGSDVTNALTVGEELSAKQNSNLDTSIAGHNTIVDVLSELDTRSSTNTTSIGTLSNLTTQSQSDLVSAINEVVENVGDITNLTTETTSDIVGAINSLVTDRGDLTTLETTEKSNIVGAINEIVNVVSNKADITNLAIPFNSNTSYNVDDYTEYQGKIYRFINAHNGDWNVNDAIEVTITNEISVNNSAIDNIQNTLNNSSTGLIVKVNSIELQVGANTTNISSLQNWVGNSSSSSSDYNLTGRILAAESDISNLKQTASSAYVLTGTITTNITPSSWSTSDWENIKTGAVYNVNPELGDDLTIQVPGASTVQTYHKGANIAWIKKEQGSTIPETYGYFDELGTTFNLEDLNDRLDAVEGDISDLQDNVEELQNRFKTTSTNWSSSTLEGLYLIIGNNLGRTGGFIGSFTSGYLPNGNHTDIGTDVFGTNPSQNFFNLDSTTYIVSALTGTQVTAIKLS